MGYEMLKFPGINDEKLDKRMRIERSIVWGLILWMEKEGKYAPFSIYNGGDGPLDRVAGIEAAFAEVFAVDDSILYFEGPNIKKHSGVRLICGNGGDIICDWGIGDPVFDELVRKYVDSVNAAIYA